MRYKYDQMTSDFTCKHCRQYVSTDPTLSGVNNRNHCPYCLWSRHMDLYHPGDRLCACKSPMQPIGLTVKRTNKKYGRQQGELMLIHRCTDCAGLSINRLAADDDPDLVLAIFQASQKLDHATLTQFELAGIQHLNRSDSALVRARLFGTQIQTLAAAEYA